jgi:hypothetical protein
MYGCSPWFSTSMRARRLNGICRKQLKAAGPPYFSSESSLTDTVKGIDWKLAAMEFPTPKKSPSGATTEGCSWSSQYILMTILR